MSEEIQTKTKTKKIKEIFSDYQTKANILNAKIIALNLIKKKNTLEIVISSDEYIEVKELWYFEKYLGERFLFENIQIEIKYTEDVRIKSIEEEWTNIICYMAHKYPLAKPMLLLKSKIEVTNNTIDVKMRIRGADFLKAKKTDKTLEKLIKNIFGKEYHIQIEEDISPEYIKKYEENLKKLEEQEIERVVSQNIEQANQPHGHENGQNGTTVPNETNFSNGTTNTNIPDMPPIPEYNDPDYKMPDGLEGYIPEGAIDMAIPPDDMIEPEVQEYIMGKPSKAKEKKIKIKDLTANDGRVTLEGRVLTCEAKETRS